MSEAVEVGERRQGLRRIREGNLREGPDRRLHGHRHALADTGIDSVAAVAGCLLVATAIGLHRRRHS